MRERGIFAAIAFLIAAFAFAAMPIDAAAAKPSAKAKRIVEKKSTAAAAPAAPDFAFPQTVASDARAALKKSMASADYVGALESLLQLTVAQTLVDRSNVAAVLATTDSVAKLMPADYAALAKLIEAQIYCDYYAGNRWKFNQRSLPLNVYPDNIADWSRGLFALKTAECVKEAFAMMKGEGVDIQALKPILTSVDAAQFIPRQRDFMTYKAIDILRNFAESSAASIPFRAADSAGDAQGVSSPYAAANSLINSLIDSEIDRCREAGAKDALAYAQISKARLLPSEERKAMLAAALEATGREPQRVMLLAELGRNMELDLLGHAQRSGVKDTAEVMKFYAEAKAAIDEFPQAYGVATLKNDLETISRQRVVCKTPSQTLSSEGMSAKVLTSNLGKVYLLRYRLPESAAQGSKRISTLIASAKVYDRLELATGIEGLGIADTTLTFPAAPFGLYIVVPSLTADASGIPAEVVREYPDLLRVSDMRLVTFSQNGDEQKRKVFIVNGLNGAPIAGAKVEFRSSDRGKLLTQTTDFTTADGCVDAPRGSWNLRVSKGKDILTDYTYIYSSEFGEKRKVTSANALTDLSVYHPGDSVKFVAVAYESFGREAKTLPSVGLKANLRDANNSVVTSSTLTADEFGRAEGFFILPTSGLLGNWAIEILTADDKNLTWQYFEVADYKAPTFFVAVDAVEPETEGGSQVKIKGKALTYSGMPVAGASVSYDIRYVSWWCWRGGNLSPDATFAGKTATDAEGNFSITLDTQLLKDTPWAFGAYSLNVSATSPAGETQSAPASRFALGSAWRIDATIPNVVEASGKSLDFKVAVSDMLGNPAVKTVDYKLADSEGETIDSGSFTSPNFTLSTAKLKSGSYTVNFNVAGADSAASTTEKFILYRASDKVPPVNTPLWVPVSSVTARAGEREVEIAYGSSLKDANILCIAVSSDGRSEQQWLRPDGRNSSVKVAVPRSDERKWLIFTTVSDLQSYTNRVEILPATAGDKLEVTTESFRDKLTPGEREHWKFRFSYAGKSAGIIPTMAVLTDKAINAVAPFRWWFPRKGVEPLYNPSQLDNQQIGFSSRNYVMRKVKSWREREIEQPEFQTWGYELVPYGYMRNGKLRVRGYGVSYETTDEVYSTGVVNEVYMTSAKLAAPEKAEMEAVNADLAEPKEGNADAGSSRPETTPLREMQHPVAFFRPMLRTDASGLQEIDFTVPDFNTTWQLQLLGYMPDMQSVITTAEATSQKPVMVSCNPPRFLRTADRATIAATLFNATDSTASIAGEIEIIEPFSGKTIAKYTSLPTATAPSASQTIEISFAVPDSVQTLLVRAYARSSRHSDGEQTLIAVLPASTPVIEAANFYLAPGEKDFRLALPEFPAGSRLTLQYCDNPIWYCVEALPDVAMPQSANLLSLIRAFYGSTMASGLAAKYPAVRQGIERIAASSPRSPLSSAADLKSVELYNTPWLNNAAAETQRMALLSTIIAESKPTLAKLLTSILALRNSDGGWSWCPGMASSEFMTRRVMLHFGELNSNGYLDADGELKTAMKGAMKFIDKAQLRDYKLNKNRISAAEAADWLYLKALLPDIALSADAKALKVKALAAIRSDWRSLSIPDKARAAIVLDAAADKATAKRILESLRQNAVYSPTLGMRYENLAGGYASLEATAQVLQAFARIEPESESVDRLRQGLIIQRQTQDWGAQTYTVDVINAIIASGSKWTAESKTPAIFIGDSVVILTATDSPTGSYTVDIPTSSIAGADTKLRIERSSEGPAWGSIISQRVAPIEDVKAYSIPQISISKAVYLVSDKPGATVSEPSQLKPGDKVRVTLTINTDRDMDYVAITDGRSACLQPADQLSEYSFADGLWIYRETRDSSTNFFISRLPKGSNVITYDCFVDRPGVYSLGIATAQSQYAPSMTAHSAGAIITVK